MDYLTITDETWGLDVEGDDLNATTIWVCCVRNLVTEESISFFNANDFNEWFQNVSKKDNFKLVTHNGIGFDIPVLNRLWKSSIPVYCIVDTLILGHLYSNKLLGGHSLAAWGERLKYPKIEFDDYSKLTDEMILYCEQDVRLTLAVFSKLIMRMNQRRFSEESCEIEHMFAEIIRQQMINGFAFDLQAAQNLIKTLEDLQQKASDAILEYFPPRLTVEGEYKYRVKADSTPYKSYYNHLEKYPKVEFNADRTQYRVYDYQVFNIGSPKQRVERLLEHGWTPAKFTEKGNPKVDEESLVDFAEESGIKEVQLIADWLVYTGRLNAVKDWVSKYNYTTKAIHGNVMSCGAGSRRCTHNKPNSANIPSTEASWGVESRSCWVARDGRVLVGIDASGLEGRVMVHYLDDPEAEAFMISDFHTANALAISHALGIEITRKPTKNIFYAFIYGAQDPKLGRMVGSTKAAGKVIRKALQDNVPGLDRLVNSVQNEWRKNDTFLETIDGGFVRCPAPHAALNYKFQSCGAIVMKKGSILLTDQIIRKGIDTLKVGDIHDEWQYDTHPDHSEVLGKLGCTAIKKAGEHFDMRIALDGEYSVGRNWAETH